MNIKKYMCLIMAMLMAFSVCFPTAVFAEDWEEMIVEEAFDEYYDQNNDFFVEDEYIPVDEWVEPFVEEQYYEAPVEDEVLVEDAIVADEIVADEPNDESDEAAEAIDVSELSLSDNDTFDAAYLHITEQPKDASGAVGKTVTFTVVAENATAYQWYVAAGGSDVWTEAKAKYYGGTTTDTISVPVTNNRNGFQFKCVVTNDIGETESEPAILTVGTAPKITEQPKDTSGAVGTTVTFTVVAENATGYQWYVAASGSNDWTQAKEKYYGVTTTDTISVPVTNNRNGLQFKCVVTNDIGEVESEPATLTVETKIEVNGVLYNKLTDTTCAVVGYTSDAASLQVEETVNGMTVTEIGKEAFMDNKNLTSIVLPGTITIIRERAFKNCENLREMK